jgi:hypothetical protein
MKLKSFKSIALLEVPDDKLRLAPDEIKILYAHAKEKEPVSARFLFRLYKEWPQYFALTVNRGNYEKVDK